MDIAQKEALTVIGIPVRARWDDLWTEMPDAWEQFFARHAEEAHQMGETCIDVSLETNGDEYVQLVGTQVSRVERIPKGMRAVEIPAQRDVHHTHRGPTQDIAESFGKMYAWAKKKEYGAGDVKLDVGYVRRGDEGEHELLIGLRPETPWRDVSDQTDS